MQIISEFPNPCNLHGVLGLEYPKWGKCFSRRANTPTTMHKLYLADVRVQALLWLQPEIGEMHMHIASVLLY